MKTIGVAFALVALFSLTAVAGEIPKGTVELSTTGAFSHQSYDNDAVDSNTTMNLSGDVGYSLTDRIALSGGLLFQHDSGIPWVTVDETTGTPEMSTTSGSSFGPQAGLRYNFTTQSNIVPFVEGRLGLLAYSGDAYEGAETTLWLPSVGAGMRVLLGETASVNFRGDFVHTTNAGGYQDLNSNDIRFGIGLSVFPGGLAMR